MRLPDFDLLRSFVSIYEHGSVSAAAKELCRSQAAISMRLKKFEVLTGEALFIRTPSRLVPTSLGSRVFERAKTLLEAHAGLADILNREKVEGRLRIGMPDDYCAGTIGILRKFNSLYPRVDLEIACELSWHLAKRIENGELDLALITMQYPPKTSRPLRRKSLVWTASPDFLWDVASPLPLALYPEGCAFRATITATLERAGIAWRPAFISQSSAGIQMVVRAGLAITAMMQDTITQDLVDVTNAFELPDLGAAEISLLVRAAADNVALVELENMMVQGFGDVFVEKVQ